MRERLRFARTGTGLVGADPARRSSSRIAIFGPFFAPHALDQPIGTAVRAAERRRAARHRLPRPRRALARALGRAQRARAGRARDAARLRRRPRDRARSPATRARSLDPLLMRSVDVLLSFPALLFLLVLVTGAGTSKGVLVLGVAIIQMPRSRASSARRRSRSRCAASSRRRSRAARARSRSCGARSCRTSSRRSRPTSACASRCSIILVASVNFLGLGLQPPSADWALMISENRSGLTLNPWAVLAPGADDRAADDRREPGRRRRRADAGHLGLRGRRAGMSALPERRAGRRPRRGPARRAARRRADRRGRRARGPRRRDPRARRRVGLGQDDDGARAARLRARRQRASPTAPSRSTGTR